MATIKTVRGASPRWGSGCFLADDATLIGDVIMGDQCSVWFQAVVRGDVNAIRIGDLVNIQDGAVIHCTFEKAATEIGDRVSIGHRAIVHGCTVHSDVLIGMGAIVMDHATIHPKSIVAAGAVVLEGTEVESGAVYAGVPATKVKDLDQAMFDGEIRRIAQNYIRYADWYSG